MSDQEQEPIPRNLRTIEQEWTYIGRRTQDREVVYAYQVAGSDIQSLFKQPVLQAPIGALLVVHALEEDTSRFIYKGKRAPVYKSKGTHTPEQEAEWIAADRAAAIEVERVRLAIRQPLDNALREMLMPLRAIVQNARTRHERQAIIALVMDTLLHGDDDIAGTLTMSDIERLMRRNK